MRVNITAPFQTENSYYKENAALDWDKHTNDCVNDINNFHYVKFFDVDETAKIFPIWYTAKTKHFKKTNDQEIIDYIELHKTKFLQKQLIPVFIDPLEGNTSIAERIDAICNYFDNTIKMYFINADYKLQFRHNKFVHIFNDQWIHHLPPTNKPIKYFDDKTYINCNRVARYHRCMLMDSIIDKGLLRDGFNTWANTYDAYEEYKQDFPKSKIQDVTFDTLDVADITATNPTNKIPLKHCSASFLYLNTETHIEKENLFISEKTYKPISIGMPFISLGNPGTLEYLRMIGFETFHDWIDESYDLDLPLSKRVDIITDNLKYIKSVQNKQSLRKQMGETIRHNFEVYKRLQRKNTFVSALKRIEKGYV